MLQLHHHSKPRLLILTSSFPRSRNDETCGYVREFAQSLAGKYEVTVLAPCDSQASDDQEPEFTLVRSKSVLPVRLDPLQASCDLTERISQGLVTKLLLCVSLFAYSIRAFKFSLHADVICSHWLLPAGLIGACAARLLSKPHIVIEHSGALHLLRRIPLGRLLARLITSGSHRVIVVSKDLRAKLLTLCPGAKDKIAVVPMGVQLSAFKRNGFSGNPPRAGKIAAIHLLFIGRLVEIKGLQVLLNACATLGEGHVLIAGDGEKRKEFENLARQLNIKATFFGQVSRTEKMRLLAICDAVVIPSSVLPDGRTEGMPVVALEAMAAGKPLIASPVGGLREMIRDRQNGLLFEIGNSAALAEKIKLLFADRKLQQTISIQAQQTVARFDWKVVRKRFEKIIADALRTNGAIES